MNPVEQLISAAVHYEIDLTSNPFLTLETIILRLYQKIGQQTHVFPCPPNEKTLHFQTWHEEILSSYNSLRSQLSLDEKACVERVLSKDSPHTSELFKFACCWYKYNPTLTCKVFAVDGILGTHPKLYVQEAFSSRFAKHNQAIRALYSYYSNPERIRAIVEKAFSIQENEPCPADLDPDFERCVALYAEMVGDEEMKCVAEERKTKPQPPTKRKKLLQNLA